MNLEFSQNKSQEIVPASRVEVETDFSDFVPQEFIQNPTEYFEREGKNIKLGEIKIDEDGKVREDPTAVKDLPVWKNSEGKEIQIVAKRVNIVKGAVGESGDPFYEYKILEHLAQLRLPAARPIAKAEQGGIHIIVMERIEGIRWSEKDSLALKEKGYSDGDISNIMTEAESEMNKLKVKFDQAGVIRKWKLADMIFQLDIENKRILNVVPTDWERTKIIEK
ncbi:MAG: hypothetical protein RI996_636 [Candidatus Parcubacteria bacterium]|jgi:hypothetical protein